MWKVVVALLTVGIGAASAALLDNNYPGCFPQFTDKRPRPNCIAEQVETWTFWNTMNYKYFAKKLTWSEAFKACDPWDEASCDGEWPDRGIYRSHPVSFSIDGEIEDAILPAFKAACIQNGKWFWTGATHTKSNTLLFSDTSSTTGFSFVSGADPWVTKGTDCVAINGDDGTLEKFPCSEKLPVMCRIAPVGNSH